MTSPSVVPVLCVVGHPNQGKSSVVSTLTENDSVQVSPESGTTRQAQEFDFLCNGQPALTLVDTPGFQRARQVLAWLEAEDVSPGQRPERVNAFLREPAHSQRFPDEVALLRPIMNGAGILYVVDGAQPPSVMDEAEMEILRWTGQPRMALINPMGERDHTQEWSNTLGQFFQWVRVFNPLTAPILARRSLLLAVGELAPGWSAPVKSLNTSLEERDRVRLETVSESLAAYWCEQLVKSVPVVLPGATGRARARTQLESALDEREAEFFRQLRHEWGFSATDMERQIQWELDGENLMKTETWYLWGLKQRDLLIATSSAGIATGFAFDLGSGGTSLMTGTVSGGLLGSVGGWIAMHQLPGRRLGWLPLTRQVRTLGPVKHPNFPLVLMARGLTFIRQLWLKPHGQRGVMTLQASASDWHRNQQVQLLSWAKRLQQGRWRAKHQDALAQWIREQLQQSLDEALDQRSSQR